MSYRVEAARRGFFASLPSTFGDRARHVLEGWRTWASPAWIAQLVAVFLAYLIAGKIGQATTNIRSSNLGPVWPAYGVALAAFLRYGSGVWPAVAASAFVVAVGGSVSAITAAGQSFGAT